MLFWPLYIVGNILAGVWILWLGQRQSKIFLGLTLTSLLVLICLWTAADLAILFLHYVLSQK